MRNSASNLRNKRMMYRSNSRGSSSFWGNVRNVVGVSLSFVVLLSLLLDQAKLAGGFPVEELSEAVAEAMRSSGISHRHHHSSMMESGEDDESNVDRVVGNMRMNMEGSLPRLHAMQDLLQKAADAAAVQTAEEEEREMREEEQEEDAVQDSRPEISKGRARALWSDDFQRRANELCRTSATLHCGRRILTLTEGQEKDLSVHMKCDLRDDFLKCIGKAKNDCLDMAEESSLPELPPKEMIKEEQSKLWKVLWTAGGCILSN